MSEPRIPDEVVLRHTCHCKAAAEPAAPGEPEEHVFTVDGRDFPYLLLGGENPDVVRFADNIYTISVAIILMRKETFAVLPFTYRTEDDGKMPFIPVIDGQDFPYICDDSGCTLTFSHKQLPTLRLTFYAHNVTTNVPIQDRRIPAVTP